MMSDFPFSFSLPESRTIQQWGDNHLQRRLSNLDGIFLDQEEFQRMLAADDRLIYEVYEIRRPELAGEFLMGLSIVHPGKVGQEFFMTKGHFHSILETAELYYCLEGEGFMVMETPEGEARVEPLSPGRCLYVPPRWAHRSVCTSRQENLVTFFAYPGNAGHDYGTIERQGFHKLVVENENGIQIVDNPRWKKA